MTDHKREARLAYMREYDRKRIANETAEQREARLAKHRITQKKYYARLTDEQRKKRVMQNRESYIRRIIRELNNEHK